MLLSAGGEAAIEGGAHGAPFLDPLSIIDAFNGSEVYYCDVCWCRCRQVR